MPLTYGLYVSTIIPIRISLSYRLIGDTLSRQLQFQHIADGRIAFRGVSLVKLILRDKEYEVKPGMTLLSALQKINVVPESVIATRDGEMILEDEILKDGDVVKLIAVISGGAGVDIRESNFAYDFPIIEFRIPRHRP